MELVGTLVLPAAIIFTGVLILSSFIGEIQYIPLGLLAAILGLPALLIFFTSRSLTYALYMIAYLLSLPVWNFVLPVYAYWHFDDFSWGETRKVAGADPSHDSHGNKEGEFDSSQIYMRRCYEYEADYNKKMDLSRSRTRTSSGEQPPSRSQRLPVAQPVHSRPVSHPHPISRPPPLAQIAEDGPDGPDGPDEARTGQVSSRKRT